MRDNHTNTFADLLIDPHSPRECHYDFTSLSVWRKPTEEELKEDPNIIQISENQLFFYRPFAMTDEEGKVTRI